MLFKVGKLGQFQPVEIRLERCEVLLGAHGASLPLLSSVALTSLATSLLMLMRTKWKEARRRDWSSLSWVIHKIMLAMNYIAAPVI